MNLTLPASANALGTWLNATVLGDPNLMVERLSGLNESGPGCLSFLAHSKYQSQLGKVKNAALLVTAEEVRKDLPITFLVVPDPKRSFVQLASHLFKKNFLPGISPLAQVSPNAEISPEAFIGPFVVVEKGARIGKGAAIHAFAYVGESVDIGDFTSIHPHVVLMDYVKIGKRVKIFPGSVIGSEGFGLMAGEANDGLIEIPQVGTVVIEDDVRIGAKCTIDRATLGETRICRGAKLDDQVHVGHNTVVGPHSVLCAQSGLSGSVTLGKGVVLGGQAGVADHVKIGDGARMGGQTGTGSDLEAGKDYFLSPAMPLFKALKVAKIIQSLPELEKRLRQLEKKIGLTETGN